MFFKSCLIPRTTVKVQQGPEMHILAPNISKRMNHSFWDTLSRPREALCWTFAMRRLQCRIMFESLEVEKEKKLVNLATVYSICIACAHNTRGLNVVWKTSQDKPQEYHKESFVAADLHLNCLIFWNSGTTINILCRSSATHTSIPSRSQGD